MAEGIIDVDIICNDIGLDAPLLPSVLRPNSLAVILSSQMRSRGVIFAPFLRLFLLWRVEQYSLKLLERDRTFIRDRAIRRSSMVAVWDQGDWEEEYDNESDQRGTESNCAESTHNSMGVSFSRRGNSNGGDQGRSFVALHLLIDKPAHGELADVRVHEFSFEVQLDRQWPDTRLRR